MIPEEEKDDFTQQNDVEDMFNSFRGVEDGEEGQPEGETSKEPTGEQEEPEGTGGTGEEKSTEGEEEKEEGSSETSEEEEAGEEGGEKEEKSDDVPEADALRKTIDRITADGEEEEEDEETPEGEQKGEAAESAQKTPFEVSDEEFGQIVKDKEKFVNFMNKFADTIRQQAREDTLRDIPGVVSKTTQRQQSLLEKKNQFFNNNPDLKEHSNYVGYTATRIYSQNPEMSVDDLFSKTAEQVRKDLALNKQAVDSENDRLEKNAKRQNKPAFASSKAGGTRSQGADNRNSLQKDLDAMIESTE